MRIIFKKYYRTCLLVLVLVPVFLISNTKIDNQAKGYVSGDLEAFNYDLYNNAKFKTGAETAYDGTKFSILKLYIEDDNVASEHSVEFIISRANSLGEIGPGKYRIAKDKDGFLNHIDGVFGFLDGKDSGALPLFAHFGEITIVQRDADSVKGYMNIYFKNSIGDAIHVSGDFAARPQ